MPKVCEICGGDHYAKLRCRIHYRFPSKTKKNDNSQVVEKVIKNKPSKGKNKDSLSALLNLAELVCHKYIRKRDSENDRTFKCISCGKYYPVSFMDAGHFIPKLSSSVRFNEFNIHGECQKCNRFDKNHLIGYEKNLIWKIGIEKVNSLKSESKRPFKWDRSELYRIIEYYKSKLTE